MQEKRNCGLCSSRNKDLELSPHVHWSSVHSIPERLTSNRCLALNHPRLAENIAPDGGPGSDII